MTAYKELYAHNLSVKVDEHFLCKIVKISNMLRYIHFNRISAMKKILFQI